MVTKIHRNLHRACWSIRRGKAPTEHTKAIALANVVFRVSEKGRQKVLAKKVRSVHAYAQGTECHWPLSMAGAVRVRYNPYKAGAFIAENGREIWEARFATFQFDGWCEVIL